jgi:hypothetical protein
MGLAKRRLRNANLRANGTEPEPGPYAGVKRWARYLRRVPRRDVKVKNPSRYLNSSSARWFAR